MGRMRLKHNRQSYPQSGEAIIREVRIVCPRLGPGTAYGFSDLKVGVKVI